MHHKWCFSKVCPNLHPRSLRGRLWFLSCVKWVLWHQECTIYILEKPYNEFEVSMCIRSGASPRCLQIVLQGVYEDVWGSWLVSIGFIDVMNVQHMHWRCHKPNLKSLCASEVVLLQGVSKSSSKESKRTSGVPGWCQLVSLMS